ncbi:TonB-dependent receptor [Pseudohaliea sp.]|uniref:TonB-dependent receptor n=1 Tax=Pseudohaliea sp. TaxID=2740289 RepID=UPI0032EC5126
MGNSNNSTFPRRLPGLVSFGLTVPTVLLVSHALAQAEESARPSASGRFALEEVIVSARRREESMQDTPISMSAYGRDDIDNMVVGDIRDLAKFSPNVQLDAASAIGGSGSSSTIFIRGVGQTDFLITTDPGVGMYLDGVYIARSVGGVLDLLDVERVEVLRGPQGTLFGRNTIGGAVNITTGRPSGELAGSVRVRGGNRDRRDLQGFLDVPILEDELNGRISVSSKTIDGYAEQTLTGRELGNEDKLIFRGSLDWTPRDDFNLFLSADYTDVEESGAAIFTPEINGGADLAGLYNAFVAAPQGLAYDSSWLATEKYATNGTGPAISEVEVLGLTAVAEWSLSDTVVLKSITGYREMDALFGRDADGSPLQYVETLQTQDQEQLSQEFHLSGSSFNAALDWMVGIYYFDENATDFNEVRIAVGLYDALEALPTSLDNLAMGNFGAPPTPGVPGGPGNPVNDGLDIDIDAYNEVNNESYAAFGQADYHLSQELSVSLGVRYTKDDKEFIVEHLRNNAGTFVAGPATVDSSWDDVNFRVGAQYRPSDTALLYASVATGFKSGGFNGRPLDGFAVQSFDPETVTAYEAGFKSEFLERTLRLNGAVYFNDYEDIQLTILTATPEGNFTFITENAAQAEIFGFELETVWVPIPSFQLNIALGYTDAEYVDLDPGATITTDTRFPKTPEWTAALGAQYLFDLGDLGYLRVRADAAYRDDYFNDAENAPEIAQEAFTVLDAVAAFEGRSGDWALGVYGKNLTDEYYIQAGDSDLGALGYSEGYVGPRREYGVFVDYSF